MATLMASSGSLSVVTPTPATRKTGAASHASTASM